jgi:hypothetical protein
MLWDALYRTVSALMIASVLYAADGLYDPHTANAADTTHAEISREPPPVQNLPDIPTTLDDGDAAAVLEGIQTALTDVADGSTYVWHRRDGRLSGMAQPTASFKDTSGQPCRHLIVMLNTLQKSRKIEGIACRAGNLRWQLAG